MILIKARGRVPEEFRKLKNAFEFEGNVTRCLRAFSRRRSFVLRVFVEFRSAAPSSCVYHAKSAAACARVTAVTRRAKFYPGSQEEGGHLRKMPDIEDVRRRDASHSIIISLSAFPKGLYRVSSNSK